MPKNVSKFNDQWLDRNRHASWVWLQKKNDDNRRAICTLCKTDFDIGNMGIAAIVSHEKGKRHIQALHSTERCVGEVQQLQRWLPTTSTTPCATNPTDSTATQPLLLPVVVQANVAGTHVGDVSSSVPQIQLSSDLAAAHDLEATSSSNRPKHSTVSNFLVKDDVTRAEIIWALNGVMCHSSLRGNAQSAKLFAHMFPDSQIASRFQMQKDKNAYVVSYGLGPYFQEQLSTKVSKCPYFAISFDESLNKVAQKGQMDVVVRFWNDATNEVATRYLTSAFLQHATSEDLLNAFTSALGQQNLNMKKMIQISMDGPNVNLKFLRELKAYLKSDTESDDVELFDIGSCSLHVVQGAYKTAHNTCGWTVHLFLRSLYYLFKDFPSRRCDYTSASKSSLFPLRFCSIRWVENSSVIKRALEIIPFVK